MALRRPRVTYNPNDIPTAACMPPLLGLPTLHLRGTPRQMGEAHGAELSATIRAFVQMRLEAAILWGSAFAPVVGGEPISVGKLIDAGRACLDAYERWDGDGHTEHCAIARAAGVHPTELYTAANMTDVRDVLVFGDKGDSAALGLRADAEGCSAVLLPPGRTRNGHLVAAQTWDLNPQDLDYVVAIHRSPDSGPQTWSVTCTGCLSLVGMNALGLCVGTTNVKTRGSRPGVGYMGILHRMINSGSFDHAAKVCETAPRAAAHTYWLASEDRAAEWETTAWSAVRRELGTQPILRTNHCLVGAHQIQEGEAPSNSSLARLARLRIATGPERRHDVASLRALFGDRSDGVDSINRLPEDAQGTATNSVVVCAPKTREIWACRGPADRGAWQLLPFD